MTEFDIEEAMREVLAGLSGLPTIIWPNDENALPKPPFIIVDFTRVQPQRRTLSTGHTLTGFMQCAILVPEHTWNDTAKTYAETIINGFPLNTNLTAGDGTYEIPRRPTAVGGYSDPALSAWRLPVQVPYLAFT